MKQFLTILKFELDNYFKSKSYVISTILIAVLAAGIMFVPRIMDAFDSAKETVKEETQEDSTGDVSEDADPENIYVIYDKAGVVKDNMDSSFFGDMIVQMSTDENEVKDMLQNEKAAAGFVINSLTDYDYYVYNKSMYNSDT